MNRRIFVLLSGPFREGFDQCPPVTGGGILVIWRITAAYVVMAIWWFSDTDRDNCGIRMLS